MRMVLCAKRRSDRGFTLLEMMVALAIAAIALAAISSAHSSSVVNSSKVYRMTTAALLMRGIVLDIEEEYQIDGFPENDQEGEDCDVPRPFDRDFTCEYSIEGMEFEEGQLESLASAALGSLTGGQDPSSLLGGAGGGDGGRGGAGGGLGGGLAGMIDPSLLPAFAMLMGPNGDQIMAMCGINLQGLLTSVLGITQFFPQIVQKAAEQTRKLTVTLRWKEGRRANRELRIQTYIVAIPEEQEELMKAMGRAEEQGLLDAPDGRAPANPQGGGRSGGGGGGGGR
ncbi:MAG: prepilin-type N-terminal cleavage/methylation domain-containing protein [Myxococcales bacterium]|nr:prepilin-type N-terminal cleavage/methylation domain-containing protein [Myxococcales bacterium]